MGNLIGIILGIAWGIAWIVGFILIGKRIGSKRIWKIIAIIFAVSIVVNIVLFVFIYRMAEDDNTYNPGALKNLEWVEEEEKSVFILDKLSQQSVLGGVLAALIEELFEFRFSLWVLLPLGISLVLAIVLKLWLGVSGSTSIVVIVLGAFISLVILFFMNITPILSAVVLLSIVASFALTCGYLLPPAFKTLPTLLREYSKPDTN